MKPCSRCNRNHTGICSIPAGITLGFGAKVGGIGGVRQNQLSARGKPKPIHKSAVFLKEMLGKAREQEAKVNEMLKLVGLEMPECDDLLDRLGKLEYLILQLNQQIIERESK